MTEIDSVTQQKANSVKRISVSESAEKKKRSPVEKICWLLTSLCVVINLSGCATTPNGFSQFYQDRAGATITNLPPYLGSTKIFTTSVLTNDIKAVYRKGYWLIGVSAFQGPAQSEDALMSHARNVGADVVLVSSVYLGSEQTAVPFVQYHPGHADSPFDQLNSILDELFVSLNQWVMLSEVDERTFTTQQSQQDHRARIENHEKVVWGLKKDDPIWLRMQKAINTVEQVCRPHIERKG